jgi:competence protein ComGC
MLEELGWVVHDFLDHVDHEAFFLIGSIVLLFLVTLLILAVREETKREDVIDAARKARINKFRGR